MNCGIANVPAVLNQYVNPVGIETQGWKFYIVSCAPRYQILEKIRSDMSLKFYCVWLAFELVVVWFLWVETKVSYDGVHLVSRSRPGLTPTTQNTPLEEIAKYFDGDTAKVGGEGATAQARIALEDMKSAGKLDTSHVEEVRA